MMKDDQADKTAHETQSTPTVDKTPNKTQLTSTVDVTPSKTQLLLTTQQSDDMKPHLIVALPIGTPHSRTSRSSHPVYCNAYDL